MESEDLRASIGLFTGCHFERVLGPMRGSDSQSQGNVLNLAELLLLPLRSMTLPIYALLFLGPFSHSGSGGAVGRGKEQMGQGLRSSTTPHTGWPDKPRESDCSSSQTSAASWIQRTTRCSLLFGELIAGWTAVQPAAFVGCLHADFSLSAQPAFSSSL